MYVVCLEEYGSLVSDLIHDDLFGVFYWFLRVQGIHSPYEWTDALVVRPGLQVCFALIAQSHGPTNSLKICFFNWRALVLTSSWTHSLDFHLFFFSFLFLNIGWFCFMELVRLHEMPGAFGMCWNPLRQVFFCSCWWGQGCPVEVWLICGSSSVFCITVHFLSVHEPD